MNYVVGVVFAAVCEHWYDHTCVCGGFSPNEKMPNVSN